MGRPKPIDPDEVKSAAKKAQKMGADAIIVLNQGSQYSGTFSFGSGSSFGNYSGNYFGNSN